MLAWPGTWTAFANLATQTHVSTWSLAIGISLFGTLFSYFLFTRGLRTVPASAVAAITTIEPLVAILLVSVFLDERMGLAQYVGVSLILIASILSGRRRQTPSPENSDSKRKG